MGQTHQATQGVRWLSSLCPTLYKSTGPLERITFQSTLDRDYEAFTVNGAPMLIASALANALLAGLFLGLPVALRPALEQLGYAERHARGLRFVTQILLVPMMLVMGLLIDKTVLPTVLVVGALLGAVGLVTLERGGSLGSTAQGGALLAGAIAALLNASVLVMPQAFFPNQAARSANLGFVAVGLGTLAAPWVVRRAVSQLGVHKALLALAFACLLPAACVACTPAAEFAVPQTLGEHSPGVRDPRFFLLFLAVALAYPLQAFLGPWVQRFLKEHPYWPGSAVVLSAGFWIAFLSSRLAGGIFFPHVGEAWLVLVLTMLAAITLGNLLGAYAPHSASLALWVTGACCGPLVPTLLGLVVQDFPMDAGPLLGLVNAAGALSTALILPWVDASRAGRSTQGVMRGAITLAVLLMAPALVLALLQ
jgi:hypothetical protein